MPQSMSTQSRIWREGAVFGLVVSLVLAAGLVSTSYAQDEAQTPSTPASNALVSTRSVAAGAVKGSQIFHSKCIVCHNKQPGDNSPFGPPNLYSAFKTNVVTPTQAEQIITHGKGQMMPSFANVLSQSEIQSVIAYLKAEK